MPEKDVEVSRKFIRLVVDFAENGRSKEYPGLEALGSAGHQDIGEFIHIFKLVSVNCLVCNSCLITVGTGCTTRLIQFFFCLLKVLDDKFTTKSGFPIQKRMEIWPKLNVYWNYLLTRPKGKEEL